MPLSPNPDDDETSKTRGETRTFEAAYRELQEVVEQLEGGGLDLERAVQLFQRGNELAQQCHRVIDDATLRVTRLAAESASPLSDAPVEP
jgi:exodeoxyribonuclease VII small subunit